MVDNPVDPQEGQVPESDAGELYANTALSRPAEMDQSDPQEESWETQPVKEPYKTGSNFVGCAACTIVGLVIGVGLIMPNIYVTHGAKTSIRLEEQDRQAEIERQIEAIEAECRQEQS